MRSEEPLTRVKHNAGVKDQVGVMWGQLEGQIA